MPLPELSSWTITSNILHQVVSLVGPIHKALLPHQNNYMHLPMAVRRGGLDSQTLPGGGKIHVELKKGVLIYKGGSGSSDTFHFSEHTQDSLFEALLTVLKDEGFGSELGIADTGSPAAGLIEKLVSEDKAGRFLTLEGLTQQDPLDIDPDAGAAYAEVMYSIFTALARFKARLEGAMTPLIVWPEHFDLSTLWFPSSNSEMDDHGPHLSVGFAPFTPGQYEYPYLYAYAYPYPDSFDPPALPAPATWHDEGWQGAVVHYHDIAEQEDHEGFVEDTSLELFKVLEGVVG